MKVTITERRTAGGYTAEQIIEFDSSELASLMRAESSEANDPLHSFACSDARDDAKSETPDE